MQQNQNMDPSNCQDIPEDTNPHTAGNPATVPHTSALNEILDQERQAQEFLSQQVNKTFTYNWNDLENKKYVRFLREEGHLLLLSPLQRKAKKVNLIMSTQIVTRNSTQCHTHHQKMIAKHKTIEGIITHYERLFQLKKKKSQKMAAKLAKAQQKAMLLKKSKEERVQTQKPLPDLEMADEPAFMLRDLTLQVDLLQDYFQIEDNILMEWLDW